MILTDDDFNSIRGLLYARFGIALAESKRSLVTGRLGKLLREKQFSSYAEFIAYLKSDSSGVALQELINKMSTNHTYFYREPSHFDFLAKVALPEMTSKIRLAGSNDLRIWCAAASSGEEPYTIIMTMLETMKLDYKKWTAGLLATDISSNVIEKAKKGVYSAEAVMNIPADLRQKYLKKIDSNSWQFSARARNEITFRLLNLMNPVFPFKKPFHLIFCRNVMIYFDQQARNELVKRFYHHMVPGGYLFTGHSESIRHCDSNFEMIQPAVYRKVV